MSDFYRHIRILILFWPRYHPKKDSSPDSDWVKFGRSVGRMYKILFLTNNCELPLTGKVVRFLCDPDSKLGFQNYFAHLYLNPACISSEERSLFVKWPCRFKTHMPKKSLTEYHCPSNRATIQSINSYINQV